MVVAGIMAIGASGDNLTWDLNDEGVLTISGTGAMPDWGPNHSAPWQANPDGILTVVIEAGITSIGDYAFFSCNYLRSVNIPNTVTRIGNSAFFGCDSLRSVTIPNSVTSIGESAFYSCVGMTSVSLGSSVTSIGENAFANCESMKTVICEAVQPPIGGSMIFGDFYGAYLFVPAGSIDAYKAAPGWTFFGQKILPIGTVFPDDVVIAGSYGAGDSTHIWILQETGLLTISGTGAMPDWPTTDKPWFYFRDSIRSVVIEPGVTSIGEEAFSSCDSLQSVTIPNTVISIGEEAFWGTLLREVVIPNSVTSIGNSAFYGCDSLQSVTIPNSVTSIGKSAFYNCESLTSLTIPNSVTSIGVYAFSGCTGLSAITCEAIVPPVCESNLFIVMDDDILLYVPGRAVAAYQQATGWSKFPTILPIPGTEFQPEEDVALWVVPLSGEERQFAFSLIGLITFDEQNMYLHDHQGELLGQQPLTSIRRIIFREMVETPTALSSPLSHIRAYPVPAHDILIVEGVESGMVRIYSMQGALLTSAPVVDGKAQVPVADLPNGNYLMQAGVEIIKFIKK